MDKKEDFKRFVQSHPEFVSYVKNKKNTWQDFYELYDLYGENDDIWNKYTEEVDLKSRNNSIDELTKIVKGINLDNVQKYINNAQKAISVIEELTAKSPITKIPNSIPKTPRPITKFFGD